MEMSCPRGFVRFHRLDLEDVEAGARHPALLLCLDEAAITDYGPRSAWRAP